MDNILKYFSGEKLQCSIGIFLALTSLAISIYFIYLDKPFFKGIAYVFIPLSLLLLSICVGVVIRTPKDIKRVSTYYENDQSSIQTEEIPRMEKVMNTFSTIKKVEIAFFILGIILLLVFWNNELIKGIGTGLIVQGLMLYLFDHFAQSRGHIYFEFLNSI